MDPLRRSLLLAGGFTGFGIVAMGARCFAGSPAIASGTVTRSDDEWRKVLTPAQFEVLREEGTERPYTSPLNDEHRKGVFSCAGCANELFASKTKFESGTGWPSFYQPLVNAVNRRADNSAGMSRTEVHCARCSGHLGHVFDDGPPPTGLRYCMNGVALTFQPILA